VSLDRMEGDESLGQALSARLDDEVGSSFSAIIKDETKCIRCALCAERCPVGAITMERVHITSSWTVDITPASSS
jgi:ferredoxin